MGVFIPQRARGGFVLEALGATRDAPPQQTGPGRPGPALLMSDVVQPVLPLSNYEALPGLYSTPQREVWTGGAIIGTQPTERAQLALLATTDTFSTRDPRKPAGLWVLDWNLSYQANVPVDPMVVFIAVEQPPLPAPPGSVNIQPLGGSFAYSGAGAAVYFDALGGAAPRSKLRVGATTNAPPTGACLVAGNQTNKQTAHGYSRPFPIYVPPGFEFSITTSGGDLGTDFSMSCLWVEAEEPAAPPITDRP